LLINSLNTGYGDRFSANLGNRLSGFFAFVFVLSTKTPQQCAAFFRR
jgi:hypothetical protein